MKQKCFLKYVLVSLTLFVFLTFVYFGCFRPPIPARARPSWTPLEDEGAEHTSVNQMIKSKGKNSRFDPHGNDTLVLIHIQKTGGTEFLRYLVTVKKGSEYLCNISTKMKRSIEEGYLVRELRVSKKGKKGKRKTVYCPRDPNKVVKGEQWLVSEKTMTWICGPHPSYTEYRSCLQTHKLNSFNIRRNVRYAVLLRHPVLRYVSEYLHVQRNATWASRHLCKGAYVPFKDMPPCYPGFYSRVPWPKLTLSKFLSCESNWANNRQTLMLADLEAVDCFNKHSFSKREREQRLLETAKKNLESFAFFGITEYMSESSRMFEKLFSVRFPVLPSTRNLTDLHSSPMLPNLWKNPAFMSAIQEVNSLDMALYEHALKIFEQRAQALGITINKNRVEEEIKQLTEQSMNIVKKKHKRLNFTIS